MDKETLIKILRDAGNSHGDYETHILNGVYDENWPQWYAAFMVGALGLDVIRPAQLTRLLTAAHKAHQAQARDSDWAEFYADYILENIGQ